MLHVFLVILLVAGLAAVPGSATAAPRGLQAVVDGLARDLAAPGAAIQVIGPGGTVEVATTGTDGRGRAMTVDTPFVWGSVAKSVAAAAIAALVQRGALTWDTSVQDLVPESRGMLGDSVVTVSDLVHHTSGLPHDVTMTDDWTRRGSAVDAVRSATRPEEATAPGRFEYASLNYLLLQAVVEVVGGGSYAQVLDREVFGAAGAAGVVTDPDDFERRVPPGHLPFFTEARPIDVGMDQAGLGYGYLAGSVSALGAYAQWRLQQLRAHEPDAVPAGSGKAYGPGLFREEFGDQVVWWHSGAVPGYYTFLALVPGSDRAVVALVNRYGELESGPTAQAGRGLLTTVLDRADPAWFPPASPTTEYAVLGVLLVLIFALVVALELATLRIARGAPPRDLRSTCTRIGVVTVAGGGLLIGALVGLPATVGVTLPVMWRWAPDATLLFWMLAGEIFLVTALVIAGDVLGCRRRAAAASRARSPAGAR